MNRPPLVLPPRFQQSPDGQRFLSALKRGAATFSVGAMGGKVALITTARSVMFAPDGNGVIVLALDRDNSARMVAQVAEMVALVDGGTLSDAVAALMSHHMANVQRERG